MPPRPTAALPRIDVVRLADLEPDALLDAFEHEHHPRLRDRLPVLIREAEQVVAQHGSDWPEVADLPAQLERLGQAVVWHMRKEEQLLYPYIRALVEARRTGSRLPLGAFGTVRNPIRVMETEHIDVDRGLRVVRETMARLSDSHPRGGASRRLLDELTGFIDFLEAHIKLEHEIVYPKAEALEATLPV